MIVSRRALMLAGTSRGVVANAAAQGARATHRAGETHVKASYDALLQRAGVKPDGPTGLVS